MANAMSKLKFLGSLGLAEHKSASAKRSREDYILLVPSLHW